MAAKYSYTHFIPENIAPAATRRIGIYNGTGNRVGQIPLGRLTFPDAGAKLYAFGALSDVHMQYETATADFQAALTYLNNEVDIIIICGDMTTNGTASELSVYKQYVDQYASVPVYAIAGNHEGYNSGILNILQTYTEQPLYYSFTHGDDVFVMVGIKSNTSGSLFVDGELQWLYETLEANRNKRCFVFIHPRPDNGCGDALDLYGNSLWSGTEKAVFESLARHYHNCILFHGHTHMRFSLQEYGDMANYDNQFGCHSVHISSLASPREDSNNDGSWDNAYAESEGYVVDVYKTGIHLRGRDFVKGEFLPIASYWLDTTLQTVAAGTYTDSTGTIVT